MYWSYKSLPELNGLEASEARRLFREAWQIGRKRPGTGKALLIAGACTGIGVVLFGVIGGVTGLADLTAIGAGIGGGIGGAYYGQVIMKNTREVLRKMGYPKT